MKNSKWSNGSEMLTASVPVAVFVALALPIVWQPAAALAQAPDATPPDGAAAAVPAQLAPAPELEAFMKAWGGSWRCESRFFANAFGPGSPEVTVKSTVRFRKDLDGHFWRGDYEARKTRTNPALKGVFFVGYDPGTNRFVITGVDNGGGFGTGVGPAEGETVTFTGEQSWGGKKMRSRETMGKRGPREGFHKIDRDFGTGYVPFVEDTCKR